MLQIGFLYSLLSAINIVCNTPFGKLADKVGRRKTVIISWIGENIFMMAFIFSPNFHVAALTFGLWIALGQMDTPAGVAWISELTDKEQRGTVLGISSSMSSILSLPSPSIGGLLYSISPLFPFYADGILSAAALALLLTKTTEISDDIN